MRDGNIRGVMGGCSGIIGGDSDVRLVSVCCCLLSRSISSTCSGVIFLFPLSCPAITASARMASCRNSFRGWSISRDVFSSILALLS